MAKVIGPLSSFEARGKVGSVVYGVWKGINTVRQMFIPANPNTQAQQNIRAAMKISVTAWQGLTPANKLTWDDAIKGEPLSGFNKMVQGALDAYMTQLGIGTTPVSLANPGNYPGVFTWA